VLIANISHCSLLIAQYANLHTFAASVAALVWLCILLLFIGNLISFDFRSSKCPVTIVPVFGGGAVGGIQYREKGRTKTKDDWHVLLTALRKWIGLPVPEGGWGGWVDGLPVWQGLANLCVEVEKEYFYANN